MAKYYGKIGYAVNKETTTGIYEEVIIEYEYIGDVIRNTRRLVNATKVNDDVTISNQISIIADPFATNNFHSMRYVTYLGTKWKVVEVEVQYPRLVLTLGGVYNG